MADSFAVLPRRKWVLWDETVSVAFVFGITRPFSELSPCLQSPPSTPPGCPGPHLRGKDSQLKWFRRLGMDCVSLPRGTFILEEGPGVNPRGPFERKLTRNAMKWASFWGSQILSHQQPLIPPIGRVGLEFLQRYQGHLRMVVCWDPSFWETEGAQPKTRSIVNRASDIWRMGSISPHRMEDLNSRSLLRQWHESLEKLLFWHWNQDSPKSQLTGYLYLATCGRCHMPKWEMQYGGA